LKHLSNVKVWAHDESETVTFEGEVFSRNCLWPKALEVLSRGCFLLRDWQVEADNYGISILPTAYLYRDIKDAQVLLDKINSIPEEECNNRIRETVRWIRKQDFYGQASRELEAWFF
jgi:hypothetical protein